jgi:hypothetical protein
MVKHIVMWKLKELAEGNKKSKNILLIKEKLHKLKPIINYINSLEVGENINSSDAAFDLVLITTHLDEKSLSAYTIHPAHQEVASFVGKVVSERKVVDFTY